MNRKDILKIFSWYSVEKIIGILFGLACASVLAKKLGPAGFGEFSYYQNIALMLAFIINLGLDGIAAREISKDIKVTSIVISAVILVRFIGFVVYAIMFALIFFFGNNENYSIFYALIFFHLFRISQSGRHYFESIYKTDLISKASIFSKFIAYIFLIYAIETGGVYFYLAIDAFVSGLVIFYSLNIQYPIFKDKIGDYFHVSKKYVKEGLPVTISLAMSAIYMQSDMVALKYFQGSVAAGTYAAATTLISPVAFVPTIILTLCSPLLVKFNIKSSEKYKDICIITSQFLVLIAYSFVAFSWFFGEMLITKVFGVSYNNTIPVFVLLSISSLFTFPAFLYCRMLVIEKKLKYELYKSIIAAACNIVLNIILVPLFGIWGAAVATLTSIVVADLLAYAINVETKHIYLMALESLFLINVRRAWRLAGSIDIK